jgi:hypothetical protein
MMPIHQRMAELWTISKTRAWTEMEEQEWRLCHETNANFSWKLAKLYNLSMMASMTKDYTWLHEICRQIETIEGLGKPGMK